MSQDFAAATGGNSELATVFQEAYQKAMTIKRLDEQIGQLAARRNALCEELRLIQSHLNEEFTHLLDGEEPLPGEEQGGGKVSVSVHSHAFAGRSAAADAAVA